MIKNLKVKHLHFFLLKSCDVIKLLLKTKVLTMERSVYSIITSLESAENIPTRRKPPPNKKLKKQEYFPTVKQKNEKRSQVFISVSNIKKENYY